MSVQRFDRPERERCRGNLKRIHPQISYQAATDTHREIEIDRESDKNRGRERENKVVRVRD